MAGGKSVTVSIANENAKRWGGGGGPFLFRGTSFGRTCESASLVSSIVLMSLGMWL